MKKGINILLVYFLFLICNNVYSQNMTPTIDMYPKTPDAAAASKFADIPAGNYTGVTDFSIPIYTINTNGVSIPISLQYTTTGIKVGEIASRVGLGWSLNSGPTLSQQVMGRPDQKEIFKKPVLHNVSDIPDHCTNNQYAYTDPCGIAMAATGRPSFINGIAPDQSPDIFSYSLLNGGGQFIMDYGGTFGIPRPYNLIKIKPIIEGYVSGMLMTDEKGIMYRFKNHYNDLTNYNSCMASELAIENDNPPNYKIDSIKLPNKEYITYTYGKGTNTNYVTSILEQENISNKSSYTNGNANGIGQQPPTKCVNRTVSLEAVLTEINFNDGKVLFYYNNDQLGSAGSRQDLNGDVYLTRVIVNDKNNHIIKDISLNYSYFESEGFDSSPSNASTYANISKRLKLIGVKDNLSLGEYKLSYYENYMGQTLPNRLSYSQDFWGVYNGKPNTTSIATVKTLDANGNMKVYLGADKEPDIKFSVIGNLRKIEYPNGGYTKITYEADDFIKSIHVPSVYNYTEAVNGPVYDDQPSIIFTIPDNAYNKEIVFENPFIDDPMHQNTGDECGWRLQKQNSNGSYTAGITGGGVAVSVSARLDVPGIYKFSVFPPTGNYFNKDNLKCSASYRWLNEVVVNDSITRKTGTIRVSKIESNSTDNGNITRKFTYHNPNTGESSGRNAGEELFVSIISKQFPGSQHVYDETITQKNRINNPGWQTSTVRGKAVGYEYVQEIYQSTLDSLKNYKKEYKFSNEINNVESEYLPANYVNVNWPTLNLDRGQLLEERLFNMINDTIRKTVNQYEYDSFFNQYATMNTNSSPYNALDPMIARGLEIQLKSISEPPGGNGGSVIIYYFNKKEFIINNLWIKNVKSTTTDYVNNQPTLVTEQISAYSTGTQRHTFPIEQKSEVVGSGISSSQHFQYALEKGNTYLKDKNMISIPLVTETTKTTNGVTNTLSKTETIYPATIADARTRIINNTNNKDIPLPYDVFSSDLKTPSSTSLELTYEKYDTDGNLLQYTTKSGITTAIIWGYNNTQPIAKIEGATYAQASSLASTIVTASDTDALQAPNNDESALSTALDNFRKDPAMVNYQITTYTYDPLVGVRSVTPPNGIRENYIYDTAGRLKEVRDINGRILKENKYNYKH